MPTILSKFFRFVEYILRPSLTKMNTIQVPSAFKQNLETESTVQRCSQEKVFRKYVANLQENTHAERRF